MIWFDDIREAVNADPSLAGLYHENEDWLRIETLSEYRPGHRVSVFLYHEDGVPRGLSDLGRTVWKVEDTANGLMTDSAAFATMSPMVLPLGVRFASERLTHPLNSCRDISAGVRAMTAACILVYRLGVES